jgi:hypothetical protein
MTRNRIIALAVIAFVVAIALYLIFKKPKSKTLVEGIVADEITFPLKFGSSGTGVRNVQKYLNEKFKAGLKVDGDWGPATAASVMLHLKRDNISKDIYFKWNLDKI